MAMSAPPGTREIYFEMQRIGPYMKVSALDPLTLVEVSVQGPASAREADLKRLAANKLKRAIERQASAKT